MTATSRWTTSTGVTFNANGIDGALVIGDAGTSKSIYPATALTCTAGNVISASADFTLLSGTSSNGRVSLYFFNASNTQIGTNDASNTALTATEQRLSLSATAPAGATTVRVIFAPRNMNGTANVRVRRALAVTGATLPAYFDGTQQGSAWSGVADNSTSSLLFIPAAEFATLRALPSKIANAPVTLVKVGETFTVQTTLGDAALSMVTTRNGSANGGFKQVSTTLGGVSIWDGVRAVTTSALSTRRPGTSAGCTATPTSDVRQPRRQDDR